MHGQIQLFREHGLADFRELLARVARDPALFDASIPYRASDHDPVIVGLDLTN